MTATHLTDRAVIRLSPGRAKTCAGFLQGLVTNDVAGALPVLGALYSARRARCCSILWCGTTATDLLLDCEATMADALVKRLSIYRLRRAIAIAIDPTLGVHWQAGDGTVSRPATGRARPTLA